MSNKNNKLHFIYLFFCKTINVFKVGSRKKKKKRDSDLLLPYNADLI